MWRREAEVFARLGIDIPADERCAAATVLRSVREAFERGRWRRAPETAKGERS